MWPTNQSMRSNTTHTHTEWLLKGRYATQIRPMTVNPGTLSWSYWEKKLSLPIALLAGGMWAWYWWGPPFPPHRKKKRGHHHREKQKYNMVREIPNYIILAPRSSCIWSCNLIIFNHKSQYLFLSPSRKELNFYHLEPRVLNGTRGFRLCLRLLLFYCCLEIIPWNLSSSYLKNRIFLWVFTLRMVSPRSPLAITATLAEDKAFSHWEETREGIRGTQREMETERQTEAKAERAIQWWWW